MTKQKIYRFTLVLKNVDANTKHLEDHLYECGCDDALINFRNGTVYLDFDRMGSSFEEAVIRGIKEVELSDVGAMVARVGPEDVVTESDIAHRACVNRQTVLLWIKGKRRKSHPFPQPIMKLSARSPLWKWHDVAEWLYRNHLIAEKETIDNALFIENINAALEERDATIRKIRKKIIKQLVGHVRAA